MRLSKLCAALVLGAAVAASSCSRSNPVAPTGALAGTWTGRIVDDVSGEGSLTVSLSQVNGGLTGEWSATFVNESENRRGAASGTVSGTVVALFLTPTVPRVCPTGVGLTGTLAVTAMATQTRLTGSYVILTCDSATSGSIDVGRSN